MGDLVPLRDYGAARAALHDDTTSPWFRPAPDRGDWSACTTCLYRAVCREVRDCTWADGPPHDIPLPALPLRAIDLPDIIA